MNKYKVLHNQDFVFGDYSIVPLRMQDRHKIMKWRNEQIYHLRQQQPLTVADQEAYFENVVAKLFDQELPGQILFSYLEENVCIGYGGLVHINWIDRNAELSFIMDTNLEKEFFGFHWKTYLSLIEQVAFEELGLHKIYTYAFDLRPSLYHALEQSGFDRAARLQEHCFFEDKYIDVIIHSKIDKKLVLRDATMEDGQITYEWANHPHTRQFAFNTDFISYESHFKWLQGKLGGRSCIYKLLIREAEPIGSLRVDVNDSEGLINYLISPKWIGKGYGRKILELGVASITREKPEIKTFRGMVKKENIASIRIFEKLGFEPSDLNDEILEFKKTNPCK